MKKNVLMMFGALVMTLAGVQAKAATAVLGDTVVEVSPSFSSDFKTFATGVALTTAYKIDNYALVPEMALSFGFVDKGARKLSADLKLFRVVLVGPSVKNWGEGKDLSVDYRVTLPVDYKSQQAGMFAAFKVRPKLSWKFSEKFSLLARSGVSLALQRNGYQVFAPTQGAKGTPAGNNLVGWDLELFPSYEFVPNWAIGASIVTGVAVAGPAKGYSKAKVNSFLLHEFYVSTEAWGVSITPTVAFESAFADGKKLSYFNKESTSYYVAVAKKF